MRKYVYPAVIYYDEESQVYVLAIEDLGLYVEGDSVEEAHARGEQFLGTLLEQSFLDGCTEEDLPAPKDYEEVCKENPKNKCVLVQATLDSKNKAVR